MNELLLDNHLAFLRRHRGEVSRTSLGYTIESTRPEFTYGIALEDGGIEPALRVVHRPEIGRATAERLEAEGFRPVGTLRYMTRETTPAGGISAPAIRVELASTEDDADIFSTVQTQGFFEREEDQREWLPFMREAARRNVRAPDQELLLARLDGVPAGVTLTVETAVVGVYAVATPPGFRKRGVATALLDAVLRRAAERGRTTATLQVVVGSAAERLYTSLGFASQFTTEIWRRHE